ncbi:unnamed protein product [Acanthoscelides obtectus]|uniref:PiggyBac transposable element-derived protein domain-containing protein n=1 Tax=Acanthoscelides obtectus TaxID=200917 RepID=A0A9P0P716_ACAOB|nr:unnamed protein product [Acanthoscelides obtectus]CAK1633489.1 hypothetical protein AOBTE_LOCUS8168 [Acanthoscelides obtectus]
MMSRSEKLLELAKRKFKESNALELESSRDSTFLTNNDFSAQNDYSSPAPSGVTRTVKQMTDGGSDSDLEWEDFDSDDSVKDKTYQCDSNDGVVIKPKRSSQGIPKEFTKNNKKSEVIGKEKSKIKIIKWVDKRPVTMITTHPTHNATLVPIGTSSKFKVMFELLLGTTVVNSWIVYNMVSDTKLSIMEFRKQLAKDLVIEQAEVPKQPVPSRKRQHTFVKPEGPGRKKKRPCTGCYKKLRITMTSREADKKV